MNVTKKEWERFANRNYQQMEAAIEKSQTHQEEQIATDKFNSIIDEVGGNPIFSDSFVGLVNQFRQTIQHLGYHVIQDPNTDDTSGFGFIILPKEVTEDVYMQYLSQKSSTAN